MTSLSQDLPAEPRIGADASMDSTTTVPVTPSGSGDATAGPISGPDSPADKPFASEEPGENDCDANDAAGSKTRLAVDGQLQILSKIKKLQNELVKVETSARLGQKGESMESIWESDFERMGGVAEQRSWAQMQRLRAQSFVKDTTAFAFGREWAHESEDSFIWNMLERQNHDKELLQRRAQWEAKKGVTLPQVDDSVKPTPLEAGLHRPFQLPAFLDPLSDELKFNDTPEAKGYNQREELARSTINEIVRQKHYAFLRWKQSRLPPPGIPDDNGKDGWPRPVARYVEWKLFRYYSPPAAFESEQKKDLSAIDVLDGEPDVIGASKLSYEILMRKMRSEGTQIPAGIPKVAHGLVPERIRLNGPHFPQIFNVPLGITRLNFPPNMSQMVLLQPYRLLVFYDQEIRKRYAYLKEQFKASDNHQAVQSGINQANHESTDADTESSREDETGVQSGHQPLDALHHDRVEETQRQTEDKLIEGNKEKVSSLANSKTALNYLGCLIDFMDTTVSIRRNYVQGPECRKIHFKDLWYLFNPGDEVVRRDEKQVYRVIEVVNPRHTASSKNTFFDFDEKDTSRYFQVLCVFLDFNGKVLGPVSTTFVIKTFAGERSVDSLEIYPLRLHRSTANQEKKGQSTSSSSQTLRQQLVKRGKKFFQAACMKLENTFYDGPTADGDEVESQVVIDFETALSSNNFEEALVPQIKSLLSDADDSSSTSSGPGAFERTCFGMCCNYEFVFNDSFVDEDRKGEYIESLIPKDTYVKLPSVAVYPRSLDDTTGVNALTDDEFLLMGYRVFAFILRTRKWAELDLNYLEHGTESHAQLHENDEVPEPAFEQLVLPEGHKNIVLSLISQHYRNRDSGRRSIDQSDIVRGKGKGLILLLHGAPGVGKTSTAEGIAEKFKKPLFTITCGDLGSTAKEVEQALDLNFTLANRWGCILLLDEADVFLASRTETDFERNGLVAVFLRVLEYYAGILFLTTNRVGVIDEAFRSRIHISLYYPPLGYDETRAVFKLNLKLIQDRFHNDKRNIKVERDEIIDFALDYFKANEKARWNGRQIRNACQTALALAEFKAQGGNHEKVMDPNAEVHLAVENFQTVSKAYLEFTKYLKQLYGIHEDVRARELGLRATDPNRQPRAQSTQPGSFYGHSQPYNSVPGNPVQTVHSQPYQPAPMVGAAHLSPNFGVQQPSQQVGYYGNPAQVSPGSASVAYGASGQTISSQIPPQSQEYMGIQYQPAQGSISQQTQPWLGQGSPPISAVLPPPSSLQAQYQYQTQPQQGSGRESLGSPMPVSQPFQGQQAMPAQQPMQQQQQQTPQTWYPNMNVQNMQPSAGQNQPGPSGQEGGH